MPDQRASVRVGRRRRRPAGNTGHPRWSGWVSRPANTVQSYAVARGGMTSLSRHRPKDARWSALSAPGSGEHGLGGTRVDPLPRSRCSDRACPAPRPHPVRGAAAHRPRGCGPGGHRQTHVRAVLSSGLARKFVGGLIMRPSGWSVGRSAAGTGRSCGAGRRGQLRCPSTQGPGGGVVRGIAAPGSAAEAVALRPDYSMTPRTTLPCLPRAALRMKAARAWASGKTESISGHRSPVSTSRANSSSCSWLGSTTK